MKLRELTGFFEEMIQTDKYAYAESPIHRVDPRVKLLTTLTVIVTTVIIESPLLLLMLFLFITGLVIVSRIPLRYFLFRATVFIPIFAGIVSLPLLFLTEGTPLLTINLWRNVIFITKEGLQKAVTLVLRVWVSVASVIFLVLTTKFSMILGALEKLKVPKVFTLITAMTYRYLFLLCEELYRMALAKEARSVGKEGRIQALKSIGNMLGTLFVRSYERSERIYMAMLARGYTGRIRTLKEMRCQVSDWAFGIGIALLCVLTLLANFFHIGGL